MNLDPFIDIPFDDDDAFDDFVLSHGMAHEKFYDVLYSQGKTFIHYPLFDTPRHDTDWRLTHQAEHESIFALLGLTGVPDLISVDFGKEDEFVDFLLIHAQLHARINQALGIK